MSYSSKTVSIKVPGPLDEWQMEDLRQAAAAIAAGESFIYAGDDDVSDDLRRFLIDHPMTLTNLEQVDENALDQ